MKKSDITPQKLENMKPSCRRVFLYLLKHGPTPLHILQHPNIGGTDAARRVRELKEKYHVDYDWKYSRSGSRSTLYWLIFEPVIPVQAQFQFNWPHVVSPVGFA